MKKLALAFLLFCVIFNVTAYRKHRKYHRNFKNGGKIVGGFDTTIQDAPYMVYLVLERPDGYYECGGSIISAQYVLTAAHCMAGVTRIFVRSGSTLSDSGGTVRNTTRYRVHPFYNPATFDYDVALVNVRDRIPLDGTNARIVQLPDRGTPLVTNSTVRVTGWGDTTENGEDSETLMGVDVPIVAQNVCRESYSTLTSRQFCAGLPEGGKDACQGDSGGPAVSNDNGLQLGIVSFGTGCARPGYPGVYTNVARVRRFISMFSGV